MRTSKDFDILSSEYPFQDELNDYKHKVQAKYDKLPQNARNWLNKAGFEGIHIYAPKNSKHDFLSLYDLWDDAFFDYETNEMNKQLLNLNTDKELVEAYLSFAMFMILTKSYEYIDSFQQLRKEFLKHNQ